MSIRIGLGSENPGNIYRVNIQVLLISLFLLAWIISLTFSYRPTSSYAIDSKWSFIFAERCIDLISFEPPFKFSIKTYSLSNRIKHEVFPKTGAIYLNIMEPEIALHLYQVEDSQGKTQFIY